MRELTVRIRFTKHSLGNVKDKDGGRFSLLRGSEDRSVLFLATWHQANMRFASQLLGRHQDEVAKISWDIQLDGVVRRDCWFRRYYNTAQGKQRYCLHEAFFPGQTVGINCVVPATITDDDLWRLMQIAGRYKGLSPWRPGEYGFFEVVSIRPRRTTFNDTHELNDTEDVAPKIEEAR
jgi:hypothetical protein